MSARLQKNVGAAIRELKSLSQEEAAEMLRKCRGCMQLVCDKLGLAVHIEKASTVRKELPRELSSMVYAPCYNWLGDEYYRAEVFSLSAGRMLEKLLVFSKALCPDEESLVALLRSKAGESKSVLLATSSMDELLTGLPVNDAASPAGADLFELSVCMVMEEVLTTGGYWVVRRQGASYSGAGPQFSYGVMSGRFPRFCERPEFDLRMNALGAPKFKEVLV